MSDGRAARQPSAPQPSAPQPSSDWLAEQLARFTPDDFRRAGELLRTVAASVAD